MKISMSIIFICRILLYITFDSWAVNRCAESLMEGVNNKNTALICFYTILISFSDHIYAKCDIQRNAMKIAIIPLPNGRNIYIV